MIEVLIYGPRWPEQFAQLRDRIWPACHAAGATTIEHVGSTSTAKPDFLVQLLADAGLADEQLHAIEAINRLLKITRARPTGDPRRPITPDHGHPHRAPLDSRDTIRLPVLVHKLRAGHHYLHTLHSDD